MSVIVICINEPEFDSGSDDGDSSSLDGQTHQARHNTISVFEARLRIPENTDKSNADEDICEDRASKPEPRKQVANVMEGPDVVCLGRGDPAESEITCHTSLCYVPRHPS
jgi:hypothetical protein